MKKRRTSLSGRVRRWSAVIASLSVAVLPVTIGVTASAAPAAASSLAWVPQPEPESFGRSAPVATTVTMDDGVVLSAQIVYPTTGGQPAPGPFPVLLSQNPYGTAVIDPTLAGDYFVKRGYIYVVASVRGTGTSGGQLEWFGQRQGRDGAQLVNWAARSLPRSDGNVGLDGCSYLGLNQWSTAAAVGRNSPLKAIAPFCTNSDFYNDLVAAGGIPTSFVPTVAAVVPRGPQDNPQTDPLSVTVQQLQQGGARSYNNDYWHGLNVQEMMPTVIANNIPTLSQSGWNDLYPGGNIGSYVAAQNAHFGRPLTAPITAGMPVTGRHQAIVGPWTHGAHVTAEILANIRKEWFDTWLKGEDTGMDDTATPLHLFQNGANRWVDTAAWPPSLNTRTYYLGAGGTLTTSRPTAAGSDTLYWSMPWFPATYNSPPLAQATVLDGPINATVYLQSTTRDAEVTATVNVVAPNGTVTKQGDGLLLGSMRQLDTGRSWYGSGNQLIQPSHPYTQASQQLLTPGQTVRMDISVLPNFTQIPAGSRIQLVLSSQPPGNFHNQLARTPQQQQNLGFGQYTVSRSPQGPSSLSLPLTTPGSFSTSPVNWGPSS